MQQLRAAGKAAARTTLAHSLSRQDEPAREPEILPRDMAASGWTIDVLRVTAALDYRGPMSIKPYPLEPLFARVLTPFEQFLRRTSAGGIVLVGTTVVALILGSWLGEEYLHRFWANHLDITASEHFGLDLSWHEWINDGLMALFFLLVGLELKREILVGELSSIRDAALPVVAAVGGMIVPAAIYSAFNWGTRSVHGWGIPMATDIAFAVGILVLLAWRIPRNLIVFLTALAIADDLGAVLVIALFYTASIDLLALGWAAALFVVLLLFNRGGLRNPLPYVLTGVLLWYALLASGIHATLAGILLAATIPARPVYSPVEFERRIRDLLVVFSADRRDDSTSEDPLGNEALGRSRRRWSIRPSRFKALCSAWSMALRHG